MKRWRARSRSRRAALAVMLPLGLGPVLSCSGESRSPASAAEAPAAAAPLEPAASGAAGSPTTASAQAEVGEPESELLREARSQLRAAKTQDDYVAAIDTFRLETDPRVIPDLVPLIRHEDPYVALTAIEAIEFLAIGTTDGVPVFAEALTWDLPQAVKLRVLEGLYEQRTEGAEDSAVSGPMLLALVESPDPAVRLEAAEYLGILGDQTTVTRLRERLQAEPDPEVKKTIDWAVRFLSGETSDRPPRFAGDPNPGATEAE